jgi:hypothetical protein
MWVRYRYGPLQGCRVADGEARSGRKEEIAQVLRDGISMTILNHSRPVCDKDGFRPLASRVVADLTSRTS